MDNDRSHLYPAFAEKVHLILVDMDAYAAKHMPGYRWEVCEGFRPLARQQELYAQGRSKPGKKVTNCDGVKAPSHHQSSLAADIVPMRADGSFDWAVLPEHWEYYGHVCRSHGLVWGGDWLMRDKPHCEWPESDKATYAAAKTWQHGMGLR